MVHRFLNIREQLPDDELYNVCNPSYNIVMVPGISGSMIYSKGTTSNTLKRTEVAHTH